MLIPIIGGVIIAAVIVLTLWACYCQSLTVPSKDLTRRWRAETSAGSRGRRLR